MKAMTCRNRRKIIAGQKIIKLIVQDIKKARPGIPERAIIQSINSLLLIFYCAVRIRPPAWLDSPVEGNEGTQRADWPSAPDICG